MFGNNEYYMASNIKDELEDKILPKIKDAVGEKNVCSIPTDFTAVNGINEYGSTHQLQIRPLTFDEAREFTQFIPNKDLNDWWWTCTPWGSKDRGYENSIAVVSPSGRISNYSCDVSNSVRPFCIFDSSIFESEE